MLSLDGCGYGKLFVPLHPETDALRKGNNN